MAAVAGSVAVGLYYASSQAAYAAETTLLPVDTVTVTMGPRGQSDLVSDTAAVEAAVRATLPVTAIHAVRSVGCPPAPDEPADAPRLCLMQAEVPAERRCPYEDIVVNASRELTTDEMRSARRDPRCDDPYRSLGRGLVYVDDGSALAAITGAAPEEVAAASAVLRSGGVVVRDATYVKDGQMTFAVVNTRPPEPVHPGEFTAGAPRLSFPAYLLSTGNPGAPPIVSPGALARAGLGGVADMMIVDTSRKPTQAELDRLRERLQQLEAFVDQQQAPLRDLNLVLWVLAGAAGLITIGAAGIATGLAAADGRADLSTLAAVGATPRLRRGLSLSQSGVIAGLGSLLGAAAGMGAAVAIVVALNQRYADIWPGPPTMPILVPWVSLAVSLLIVPLVAMLGAGMLTRSRLPIERRI
jgi:putative ABC transport system permease protein